MSKKTKKDLEKLSSLKKEMLSLIEEYNKISKKINLEERVGLLSAKFFDDEYEDEGDEDSENVEINWDKRAKDGDTYEAVWCDIDAPGAQYWMPSGINC